MLLENEKGTLRSGSEDVGVGEEGGKYFCIFCLKWGILNKYRSVCGQEIQACD